MIANGRWRRIVEVVPATSRLRHLAIGYASEKTTSKYPDSLLYLINEDYRTTFAASSSISNGRIGC